MTGNTDMNWVAMSDRAIMGAIGNYVKDKRLSVNKTQAQISEKAGINRWTLGQLEKGESVTLVSLIQILRALDLLHILDVFKVEKRISPIELAKIERQKRQRARGKEDKNKPQSDW